MPYSWHFTYQYSSLSGFYVSLIYYDLFPFIMRLLGISTLAK